MIVNRDDIRSMLGDYWVPMRENLVTIIEDNMIKSSLTKGYSVIVDATNLNPKTLAKLVKVAQTKKVDIEYIPIKISVDKAYRRILWRRLLGGRFISRKIIQSFYNRYEDIIGI